MSSNDISAIVHAAGFITGIVLYAMLAAMSLRSRIPESESAGANRRLKFLPSFRDRIPVITAMLGIVWNAGGLVIYAGHDIGAPAPSPYFIALAFSALGFLPAVVVHAAAGRTSMRARWLTNAAYSLSFTAALLQFYGASIPETPFRPALVALTTGYGAIIAALVFIMRGQKGGRAPLAAAALAAFAVMALHLSHHVEGSQSIAIELLGHHATLPLVVVILYQDYRFALADLFLKRALTVVTLVSVALAAYLFVGIPYIVPRLSLDPMDPRGTAALVSLWVAVALVYPILRSGISRVVDRIVLRRVDSVQLRHDAVTRLASIDTELGVLDAASAMLAPALSASVVKWSAADSVGNVPGGQRNLQRILVQTAEAPGFVIEIGALAGGRRMLSDDTALAEAVAQASARRIDVLRVAQERHERSLRERDLQRLTAESHFRALQAQLNPHFLFNALTTIGFLLHESPQRALDTLLRLTTLLRAVLRKTTGGFVTLGEEMDIVEAYLAIERARFEERMNVHVDVADDLRPLRIPPLLLQPLVENAAKHGISRALHGGTISVTAKRESSATGSDVLRLRVSDTGAGTPMSAMAQRRLDGTGLNNLAERLRHYYGPAATLDIRSGEQTGTQVEILLPLSRPVLGEQHD